MNKEQPKQFSFKYPVIEPETRKLISELEIRGIVDTGRLKEALDYNILHINHTAPGERVSSDIKTFLYFTNHFMYNEICDAALNHATEKYGLKRHTLITG